MKIDTDTVTTCYDTPIAGMRSYNQPSISGRKRDDTGKFRRLSEHEKKCSSEKRAEYLKAYKEQNKERSNQLEKIRRERNPEYFRLKKKKYRANNPGKDKEYAKNHPEIARIKSKEGSELLTDNYIAGRLTYKTSMTCNEIRNHPELIEIKRLIIKTKRLCKTLQNSDQV